MKLRNYFFGALACLALASCSSDDDAIDSGQEGKDGVACIAVKFEMPGTTTRAWASSESNDDYFAGDKDAEKTVSSAVFFLYKDGVFVKKCDVVSNPETTTDGATLTVERFFEDAHIVIVDDVTPTHILAVLNGSDGLITEINEKSLAEAIAIIKENELEGITAGITMTNSVYVDGSNVITATPINGRIGYGADQTEAENAAKAKPVTISVERVFARVNVTSSSSITNAGTEVDGVTVIPEIKGWWLDNTNKQSYAVKSLTNAYTFALNTGKTELSETNWWNDAKDFRSYWANAAQATESNINKFGHYTWGSANNVDKYCFENINQAYPTQIVVAAVLKEGGVAVDVIQWAGKNFVGATAKTDFYSAVITSNSLNDIKKKETSSPGDPTSITSTDLNLIWNNKTTIQKYKKKGDTEYTPLKDWQSLVSVINTTGYTYYIGGEEVTGTDAEKKQKLIDAVYQRIGTVNFYNGGQTYYFTEIEHEPVYQETDFAVIRNHYYKLTLNSITGLGTPVPNPADPDDDPTPGTPGSDDPTPDPTDPYYPDPDDPNGPDYPDPTDPDPDQPIIPEKPTDNHSAISATVQILKYRVVSQSVNLK